MRVLTLGTFDIVHRGHINLFHRCREIAGSGVVIVAVNTDDFIRRYRGKPPVMSYEDRAVVVAACGDVDEVVPNDQPNGSAADVIAHARPTYIVVGSDWEHRDYFAQIGVSANVLESLAVEVVYVPYTDGISSTQIKARLAA